MSRPPWRLVLAIVALSLAVRILWACFAEVTPVSDFAEYDQLARKWLASGAYETTRRPPGYPGLLAAVYALFGGSWRAAYVAQAVVGAVTSGLIVLLASRMVARRSAAIAGLLHALWPTAIVYVALLASENLATPLTVALLLALTTERETRPQRCLFVALGGVAFGVALLVRPALLFLFPAAVLLSMWEPRAARWRVISCAVFVVAAWITVLPWQLHNARRGVGITTLSTTGGIDLWMANNDDSRTGGYEGGYEAAAAAGFPTHEPQRDRALQRAALSWIVSHPGRYLQLSAIRTGRFWGPSADPWSTKYLWPAGFVTALRLVLAPCLLAAFAACLRRRRVYAPVLLPVASYALLISLTFFQPRFREVSDALLLVPLAALTSDLVFGTTELGWPRPRRDLPLFVLGAVAVVVGVVLLL